MSNSETAQGLVARINRLIALLNAFPLWPVQSFARIGIAAVFYNSASLKLQSWDITLLLFRDEYKVPLLPYELAAKMATTVEMSCAILLFAGLFSRLATLPLFGVIAVIQTFVYPNAWAEHMSWVALLLVVLTRGPGPLSLDYLLTRQFGLAAPRAVET